MVRYSWDKLAAAFEQVLAAQDRLHSAAREDAQQSNLIYAIQEIRPNSHTELALVVWAGTRCQSPHVMVDEYCRRRAGLPSRLFDHPLLALQGWCLPGTLRLMVFREQLEALAKQLTGKRDGRSVVRGIYRYQVDGDGLSLAEFCGLVDPANGLSGGDIELFYDYLRERYAESLPYVWCSTIVEQAILQNDCECLN